MSLVSSINIAQQALAVNQAAITTVSNNIANVDTKGYSKLRVNQAEVINYTPSAGNAVSVAGSSSGVTIQSITRYSNSYLQNYYWQENTTYSYLNEYSSIASNVEDLVNELKSTGLSSALSTFYNAANALSNNPNDITARQNYVDAANNVCSVFNGTSNNLNNIKESLVGDGVSGGSVDSSEISSEVKNVNNLLDQLAQVNADIIKTNNGENSAAALLDQRDTLVSSLSALIPVNVSENPSGTVNIALGNYSLVQGTTLKGHLSVSATGNANNPVKISIVDSENPSTVIADNVNSVINNGSIGAILDICGSDSTKFTINNIFKSLDKMASNFSSVLNSIQTVVGYPSGDGSVPMALSPDGKTLIPTTANDVIFKTNDGSATITAANITVNSSIVNNPYLVAAARVKAADVGNTDEIGNNTNMQLVMNARNTSYPGLDNTTLERYLSNMVSNTGADAKNINTNLKNQQLVLNEIETNLQSAIGVNMDEELTDLIKYQRAYQAAAKVFNICDSLLDELVNLGK